MKNMRDHLFSLGASCVMMLGVVLAQDQAPAVGQPLPAMPPAAPAAEAAQPAAPAQPAAAAPGPAAAPAPAPEAQPAVTPAKPPVLPQVPTRRSLSPLSRRTSASPSAGLPAPAVPGKASSVSPSSSTNSAGEARSKTMTPSLKFDNAPVDIILQAYAQETGKTLLMAPDAPKANITLKSQPDVELSKEEYIEAIEVVLSMNGVVLEPFGEKFVKVLARKTVRTDGIKILMEGPEGGHPEKSRVVSQMIQLKSITVAEAQKALEGFKKPDGLFQIFERTNSILVTDTQENVNRMMEIVKFIDQPMVATEEVNVRIIRYAKAEDIKKRIEELVAESQKQQQAKDEIKANVSGAPGITRTSGSALTTTSTRPLPPGLTRLGAPPQAAPSAPNETLEALVSDADRGMIRGKVQIIADERTNQLIFITRAENMAFFEKIIAVLDIETLPDVKVEMMRLEYADAEEVSTMLNDLIGNVSSKKDEKSPAAKGTSSSSGAPETPAKSTTLAEAVAARSSRPEAAAGGAPGEPGKSKLGQLSKDNIKILSDKRTNALVMMGSLGDLAAIKEIVKSVDIQLSQVLIETVVLQVTLKNEISTGIDWVKRIDFDKQNYRYNLSGGGGRNTPTDLSILENVVSNAVTASAKSGLQYFATLKDLNLDAVISASKSDNATKVLSSPILLTVDNKEATIEATEMKYMYKGMRYMGYSSSVGGAGSYEPDIEQRDVGLTIKITPRISPNGNVILTVDEKFEDVLGNQTIQGQEWPTVTTRKLTADVSVGSGETVILGGLVKTGKTDDSSGIPILKDIPYIGKYLFGKVGLADERSEMLVFLTPYVIKTADDMSRETRRRKEYINADGVWTKGWSDSQLADPVSEADMKQRLERTKALESAWIKYRDGLGEKQEMDARLEEQRALTQAMMTSTAAEAPQAGLMNVTETVEVLRPEGGETEEGAPQESEPLPPPVEEPKKSWWKIF